MAEEAKDEGSQESDSLPDAVNAELQIAAAEGLPDEANINDMRIQDIGRAQQGWLEATAKDERAAKAARVPKAQMSRRLASHLARQKRAHQREEQKRLQVARAWAMRIYPSDQQLYTKGKEFENLDRIRERHGAFVADIVGFWRAFWYGI